MRIVIYWKNSCGSVQQNALNCCIFSVTKQSTLEPGLIAVFFETEISAFFNINIYIQTFSCPKSHSLFNVHQDKNKNGPEDEIFCSLLIMPVTNETQSQCSTEIGAFVTGMIKNEPKLSSMSSFWFLSWQTNSLLANNLKSQKHTNGKISNLVRTTYSNH